MKYEDVTIKNITKIQNIRKKALGRDISQINYDKLMTNTAKKIGITYDEIIKITYIYLPKEHLQELKNQ